MPTPDGAMTLQEYADRDATIVFVCKACLRSALLPAAEAVKRYGPEREAYSLEARAKCSECGGGCRQSFRFPLSGPSERSTDPENFSTPGKDR